MRNLRDDLSCSGCSLIQRMQSYIVCEHRGRVFDHISTGAPMHGILLNKLPKNLTTAQVETFFPSSRGVFIPQDAKRPDGTTIPMDHKWVVF